MASDVFIFSEICNSIYKCLQQTSYESSLQDQKNGGTETEQAMVVAGMMA